VDEYDLDAELDAEDTRAAERRAEREAADDKLSESRTSRVLADAAASARAELTPTPLDPRAAAIERATAEETAASAARRLRIAAAYDLYGKQRSSGEIVAILVSQHGVSEATARSDLQAVRDIVDSWRNLTGWHERRDQHAMGLRHLLDLALADHATSPPGTPARGMALDQARKVMADMRAVEGFNAPTKGLVLHGHGSIDTTLPDGPGVVGGVSLRKLKPHQLAAVQLLLGDGETVDLGSEADLDASPRMLDAVAVEASTPPADD
jgi:hypothetical protein